MILLRMNLAGWFDLYLSRGGSAAVKGYFPPSPGFVGRDGDVVVERLVDVIPGGDQGRTRYLLYITDASMSETKRRVFQSRLLEAAGREIDTLMRADNQVEASDLVDRVRAKCEELERAMEEEGRAIREDASRGEGGRGRPDSRSAQATSAITGGQASDSGTEKETGNRAEGRSAHRPKLSGPLDSWL